MLILRSGMLCAIQTFSLYFIPGINETFYHQVLTCKPEVGESGEGRKDIYLLSAVYVPLTTYSQSMCEKETFFFFIWQLRKTNECDTWETFTASGVIGSIVLKYGKMFVFIPQKFPVPSRPSRVDLFLLHHTYPS